MCDPGPMAQIVCPVVSAEDRARLEAIVADRNRAQKHVARARIILASAERLSVAEVAKRARIGRPAVWRWQRRFAEAGVDGLLRDATRKPASAPGRRDGAAGGRPDLRRGARRGDPLDRPCHGQTAGSPCARCSGSGRPPAAAPPHPTFKRSNDPEFATKLEDIVGLYVEPPAHSLVLSIYEKSQIQALTDPALSIKRQ